MLLNLIFDSVYPVPRSYSVTYAVLISYSKDYPC